MIKNKIKNDFEEESFGSLSRKHNNFYIYGDINDDFGEKIIIPFIEEMKLQKDRRFGLINIYIQSPGGLLHQAKELIALMEQCKKNLIVVKTFVNSYAFSAASMIAVAGHVRTVGKDSRHLIHNPIGGAISASKKQLDNNYAELNAEYDYMLQHYKKYTKIKDLESKLEEGNHFIIGYKELIKQGLADQILEDSVI